ncbi:glycosyltransferase [Rhodococcus sp. IEGM 1330]|uniref:glycosyltransferase n=1 Tax=Rhodococcus sp. IEGM 1330 TaxID=3082225 RepID=UPI0029546AFD|nr:glycosyltransferase [Rhodococcus sp. IEGM 1330]MDV8023655.1 glycosyltransferase [Rhodococcus sp. IEGM 1330]
MLAKSKGWDVTVLSYFGSEVWAPLRNSEFERACEIRELSSYRARVKDLVSEVRKFDLVLAVKPLPKSLGLVLAARKRQAFSLLLDIDDPDLDARLDLDPLWRAFLWRLRFFFFWIRTRNLRSNKNIQRIVSNPTLQEQYGGLLVPHARRDNGPGKENVSTNPTVTFVGTPRNHKGIDLLRKAVTQLAEQGFRLKVTASAPSDARPWEDWIGTSSLEEGLKIVADADIVVIPSRRTKDSLGQLPVKLVDAMMAGRAVIVSNVEPMPWAVGSRGAIFRDGDLDGLIILLKEMADPEKRNQNGDHMRARALEIFEFRSLANAFDEACELALKDPELMRSRVQ